MESRIEVQRYGDFRPTGRSRVAAVLFEMPINIRRTAGIDDFVIVAIDVLVTGSHLVVDDSDTPMLDRFSRSADEFPNWEKDHDWMLPGLQRFSDGDVTTLVNRLTNPANRKALLRSIGSASFRQLHDAFTADTRVLFSALRIGIKYIRPWAIALDDALDVLTTAQREAANVPNMAPSFFGAFMQLLAGLDYSLSAEIGLKRVPAEQRPEVSETELMAATDQIREIIRGQAETGLSELNSALQRKLRGARDALEHSVDGVSQAANSLVELVDRFARMAFSEVEVIAWLEANGTPSDGYLYTDAGGSVRPTKRAQILCLVWAGTSITETPEQMHIHSLTANTLLNIRTHLQKLKHADESTPEESQLLSQLLQTLEGAVLLMVRACWLSIGQDRIAELKRKFDAL